MKDVITQKIYFFMFIYLNKLYIHYTTSVVFNLLDYLLFVNTIHSDNTKKHK